MTDMMKSINKKRIALITGATGSLGRSIVEQFSASGKYQEIYAIYFQNAKNADAISKLSAVIPLQLDLLALDFHKLPHNVDVLVNNAALASSSDLSNKVSRDEYNKLMKLNSYVPLALAQHFIDGMIFSGWGRIINIGSIWSIRGSERNLAYTMSKHALSGLTKTIALEFGSQGINCNEVCPGPMESEMIDRIFENKSKNSKLSSSELKAQFENSLRSKKLIQTHEVASVVSFLASEKSSGINGVSIPVDLGITI